VLGSKVVIPVLMKKDKSLLSKYANWAFTNGCNLVRGKKFSLLSLPSSIIWIIAFMSVGAVVSKNYATKCWIDLYKDNK
jgi:membrane protein DedA with SNARE-associated domain